MSQKDNEGLTYSEAGVDIDRAEEMVSRIKDKVKETHTKGVIGELGGFGGLFAPDFSEYEEPVLVSGTDGVGTKLKVAQKMDKHDTIGIDLVAMCINDILAQGAHPLFFLDYLSSGKLDIDVNEAIISGIVEGCKQAKAALIGGETAEMPGVYPVGEYDLAGFAVGIVDREKIITGQNIESGDLLLGLASNGLHSNGFSLVRHLIKQRDDLSLEMKFFPPGQNKNDGKSQTVLGEQLLQPTRIYAQQLLPLLEGGWLQGIAHITGGGLLDNIPRILPEGLQARIYPARWPQPPIFDFIQQEGNVDRQEMYNTFNMGIGLVMAVKPGDREIVEQKLNKREEKVYNLGVVESGEGGVVLA